jgi:hypothetical protein
LVASAKIKAGPPTSRAFLRFAFLELSVMTFLYALYRHDVMFPWEHCAVKPGRAVCLQLFQAKTGLEWATTFLL